MLFLFVHFQIFIPHLYSLVQTTQTIKAWKQTAPIARDIAQRRIDTYLYIAK